MSQVFASCSNGQYSQVISNVDINSFVSSHRSSSVCIISTVQTASTLSDRVFIYLLISPLKLYALAHCHVTLNGRSKRLLGILEQRFAMIITPMQISLNEAFCMHNLIRSWQCSLI